MHQMGLSATSVVFSNVSRIDILVSKILSSCLSDDAHNYLDVPKNDLIRISYV